MMPTMEPGAVCMRRHEEATKQGASADAVADLGKPDEIGRLFSGFQKYLYQQGAVA